jgi:hypothetical protein
MRKILKGDWLMAKMAKLTGKAAFAVLLGGMLIGMGGCANTNNRDEDTRGASLLFLQDITGGENDEAFVLSDVCIIPDESIFCSVVNDNATATLRNEPLNPEGETSYYQDIVIYRTRVTFTRSDGRNTQGVDVPWAFDSVTSATIPVNGDGEVAFIIVRHTAKSESPLVELRGLGDEFVLSTNARCDFWGRDIAGNEHHVFGWIDVEFADFADE